MSDTEGEVGRGERRSGLSPAPSVERGPEAADRRGDPRAWCFGADGRPALQRQRQSGGRMAAAVSRAGARYRDRRVRACGCRSGARPRGGCGDDAPAIRRSGGGGSAGAGPDGDRAGGRRRVIVDRAVDGSALARFLRSWSGDDPCSERGAGVACERCDGHAARHEHAGAAGSAGSRRDPHAGDLFVFRGRRGDLIKILWHDGLGTSLYAKRLERGRFLWPSPADGAVSVTAAQLGYLLEGIDWRNPVRTWRPLRAG